MTIRCAIVDDEPLGRQIIREYLEKHPDIEIVIDSGRPEEACEAIDRQRPELLFLDIQMPQIDGFELLRLLPEKPVVIFCTAYDRYAIAAFEANAVDYLLKPFDQQRFDAALNKARQYLNHSRMPPRLEQLIRDLPQRAPLERIAVRKGDHLKIVNVSEIYWLEALEDYVRLHTARGQYLVPQRLGDLEQQLDRERFLRIHRSSMVNLDMVEEIHPWSSGRYLLRLKDGSELETSKSGAKRLRGLIL